MKQEQIELECVTLVWENTLTKNVPIWKRTVLVSTDFSVAFISDGIVAPSTQTCAVVDGAHLVHKKRGYINMDWLINYYLEDNPSKPFVEEAEAVRRLRDMLLNTAKEA